MSYINEKERMKQEAQRHRKNVWLAIKITFILFALCLLSLVIVLAVSLFSGKALLENNEKDTEAPTITGPANNIYVGYVGETPHYKQMVKIVDNLDEDPQVKIDNSRVNKDVEGEYQVLYVATDAAGNKSKYVLTYVVKGKEYSKTTLMELIAVEAEEYGITKQMSKKEQVKKIYTYVQSHVSWEKGASGIGESNIPNIDRKNWETDWVEEAVRTLESECGDCYSYYSLSKAFFEYFGIENEGIQRSALSEEVGTHFWNVVKVEEGWYYYDGTRLAGKFSDGTNNACLITQSKLDSYITIEGIKKGEGGKEFYLMDRKISKISKTPLD